MEEYCIWNYEEDFEYYETSCENNFHFIDGNCRDNKFTFCPYCGKPIMEIIKQGE